MDIVYCILILRLKTTLMAIIQKFRKIHQTSFSRLNRAIIIRWILELVSGDIVVIRYTTRNGVQYTWFINDNWILLIIFLASYRTVFLIKKKWKKPKMVPQTRGGSLIEECIKYNSTYEIIDEELKVVIRRLLEDDSSIALIKKMFSSKVETLVITPSLFFLAQVIKENPILQLTRISLELTYLNLKRLFLKACGVLTGGVVAAILLKTAIAQALFFLLSTAGVFLIGSRLQLSVDCNKLLRELPQIPIEQIVKPGNLTRYFLDTPKHHLEQTILLKDFQYSDDSEVYVLEKTKTEICSAQTDKFNRISQKCESEKQYKPIKETRSTDKDVLRWDSIDNTRRSNAMQKNYHKLRSLSKRPEKVKTEKLENSILVKFDGIEPVIEESVKLVRENENGVKFFSAEVLNFVQENVAKLLDEHEDVVKPSTTSSTSDTPSQLFRNPNRRSKVKIPLHKRTNTFTDMIKEDNFGGYPYPSDDIPESSFKPSEKVPEKAE